MQNIFDVANNISFIAHIWTNVSNHSSTSVTGHCLDINFKHVNVVLRVVPFDESHTVSHVSNLLKGILIGFHIA